MNATKEQVNAYINALRAIAEAIRELGSIPSGHLYATLMGKMSLDTYTQMIGHLKKAGLVEEQFNELKWIGPKNDK